MTSRKGGGTLGGEDRVGFISNQIQSFSRSVNGFGGASNWEATSKNGRVDEKTREED